MPVDDATPLLGNEVILTLVNGTPGGSIKLNDIKVAEESYTTVDVEGYKIGSGPLTVTRTLAAIEFPPGPVASYAKLSEP